MKVKILLPPLIIVICIGLMVWLVYPAYTNGIDGWKERRDQLNTQKSNLADAQQKAENVSKMVAQLEGDKASKDTIATFVPDQLREEEIMDNLNFIASNEGLSVVKLSITPESVIKQELNLVDASGNSVTDHANSSDNSGENTNIKSKNYDVALTVVGNYDKIKNTLDKIYRLKRYNSVKTLDISESKAQGSEKNTAPTDNLEAEMVLTFSYLKKFNQAVNMNNSVFSQPNFDMKIAQDIRDKKSVDVLKMNIDQAGRNNPFVP